jgi:hypothetical protein
VQGGQLQVSMVLLELLQSSSPNLIRKKEDIKMMINKRLKVTIFGILFLAAGFLSSDFKALAAETGIETLCSSIPLKKAAVILSAPENDLQQSHRELMVSPEDIQKKIYKQPPLSCSIRSKTDFLKLITYVIYVFNDSSQAQVELKKIKEGFETVSKVEGIENMGDEAFWVADQRFQRFVARKSNTMIDILSPKDFEHQTVIMQMIMDKL